MRLRFVPTAALIVASALSLAAHASPSFYATETSFLAAVSGATLSTESFETFSGSGTNLNSLASGLNIQSNTSLSSTNTYCAVGSKCLSFSTPLQGSSQVFTFDEGAVNAFGFALGDLGTVGDTTLSVTTSTGASASYVVHDLGRGNQRYLGVLDLGGYFTSVTVQNSDSGDLVTIDNVRWGTYNTVPEPGDLALLSMGMTALALRRRKA